MARTSACVAAGFALATWALPVVPTPANVAKAYVEARFARDTPGVWDVLCQPTRSGQGDYRSFAEYLAYLGRSTG